MEQKVENLITNELIENTYLYCWKKLSAKEDAKDVAQEIVLDAMLILRSGKKIENFYGLYWRIAHNKVVDFYRRKRPANVNFEDMENVLLGFDKSADDYITKEEIQTLSSSMTQLAQIHRDILVRFYVKGESVKDIANALKIPTGTVTSRLADARRKLKENFVSNENEKLNKENNQLPELNLEFYWLADEASEAVSSLIDVQLLYCCHDQKKSVEQLAKEMQVSSLFIEDSIKKLEKANLLFEASKGKYQTDFCFFPNSVLNKAAKAAEEVTEKMEIVPKFMDMLLEMKDEMLAEDFYGNNFQWEYLLPYFIIRSNREFAKAVGKEYLVEKYAKDLTDRRYRTFFVRGTYMDEPVQTAGSHIIGKGYPYRKYVSSKYGYYELHDTIRIMKVVQNGKEYNLTDDRIDWINAENGTLYFDLIENPGKELSAAEESIALDMLSKGVLVKDGDKYIGSIPVISQEIIEKWMDKWHKKFRPLAEQYEQALYDAEKDILLPYIRPDLLRAAFWYYFPMSGSLDSDMIQYALDKNMVRFEEGTDQSCVSMVIVSGWSKADKKEERYNV